MNLFTSIRLLTEIIDSLCQNGTQQNVNIRFWRFVPAGLPKTQDDEKLSPQSLTLVVFNGYVLMRFILGSRINKCSRIPETFSDGYTAV